eukprot:SAG11_NODE_2742_length_3021_cov_2.505476_4_plen_157_part_00
MAAGLARGCCWVAPPRALGRELRRRPSAAASVAAHTAAPRPANRYHVVHRLLEQINPMSGACTPAQPSDCAAIPAANGSSWHWTNTSMWSWSYGCLSRIRSEKCDMVAAYACPDDGKSDGHGEYLPRKATGIEVPGHTTTPEECIAQGPSSFEPSP